MTQLVSLKSCTKILRTLAYLLVIMSCFCAKNAYAAASVNNKEALPIAAAELKITTIDFRRTPEGAGRILLTLSDPKIRVEAHAETNKLIVDFHGAKLPSQLQRKLDVIDFGTPVQFIDTKATVAGVRMLVEISGDYEHEAYQANDTYVIEVRALSTQQKEAPLRAQHEYTGQHLSLNFQDIEVRAVLQLIADFTGLNLVASDSVRGNVTLRLQNVPWDQALDIILKSKGLDKRKVGNVIMVAPQAEIAASERRELKASQRLEALAPLHSEFMQINYAKASAIADLLKVKENSMLSPRGTVSVDERTNTLLIQDTTQKIEQIHTIIARLDKPVEQVLIQSRIVTVTKNHGKNLGAQLGFARHNKIGNKNIGTSGDISDADNVALGNNPGSGLNRALNVNLPVSGAAGSFALSVAKLNGDALLDLELSALETQGLITVLSNPSVVTANQKQAIIREGSQIPYQEAASSGATTTQFIAAVLELKVTPQITPDRRIIMDLNVKNDDPGAVNATGIPSIDTREVSTQVLVNNGQTIVLGGIYTQAKHHKVTKVPYLADVPLLGALFRNVADTDNRTELLVFVTPKVLTDSMALR